MTCVRLSVCVDKLYICHTMMRLLGSSSTTRGQEAQTCVRISPL